MDERLQKHIDQALNDYTTGIHYEALLEAKEEYFSLTGQVHEDDHDYENRMNSFSDWYVMQFISSKRTRTAIKDYLVQNNIDKSFCKAFLNVNHSLFEYLGENLKKQIVLKDILHDKKVVLIKDHQKLALLKDDIFIGRSITYDKLMHLMSGQCILPKETKPFLKKCSKKIRRLKDQSMEETFLLKLEFLNSKRKRYRHLDPIKIFVELLNE